MGLEGAGHILVCVCVGGGGLLEGGVPHSPPNDAPVLSVSNVFCSYDVHFFYFLSQFLSLSFILFKSSLSLSLSLLVST